MKKLILSLLLILAFITAGRSFSENIFYPVYWITGRVEDAAGASADGMTIYFANSEAWDVIGVNGNSGKPNHFIINAGRARVPLVKGLKYSIFTEKLNNHGFGPFEVTLSGLGLDEAGIFMLKAGAGVAEVAKAAAGVEPNPAMRIWFGNRLYQPTSKEFYVPQKPKIRVEVEIPKPYTLASVPSSYKISIDQGAPMNFEVIEVKENKAVLEIELEEELSPGEHILTFQAKSSGAQAAAAAATQLAKVIVSEGGPLSVRDQLIAFPNPFDPSRDHYVTIQYTLNVEANVDIYIFSPSAEIVKKFIIRKGEEGSKAELNKVQWDGVTDRGVKIASGAYVVNVVDHDTGKPLAKTSLFVHR